MKCDSELEVTIFTEALKITPLQRQSFLERRCGGDEHLRLKVEALLSAHDRLGDFLEGLPDGGSLD